MTQRHWRLAGASLFVALAVSACTKTAEDHARDMDREANRDAVLGALRDNDPRFYAQIRDRAASRLASGMDEAQVLVSVQGEMRAYGLRQGPNVAKAPGAAVIDVMESEARLIEHLQDTDVGLCAAFAITGMPAGHVPTRTQKTFIDRAATARLVAGKAGRDTPVDRDDPTEADFIAVYQTMLNDGVPEQAAQRFFNEGLGSSTPREQCDVTTAFYSAILGQPRERAEKVSAFVIRTVAEQAAAAVTASSRE